MKTVIQELIEELKANDVAHGMYWIKRPSDFFEKYLEKEKEQILEAVKFGQNNHTVSIPEDEMIAKNYFNDKYEVVEEYNQNK
jgi:hypothetical protein